MLQLQILCQSLLLSNKELLDTRRGRTPTAQELPSMLVRQALLIEQVNGNWELMLCQYSHSLPRVTNEERKKIQASFQEFRREKRINLSNNHVFYPRVRTRPTATLALAP